MKSTIFKILYDVFGNRLRIVFEIFIFFNLEPVVRIKVLSKIKQFLL